MIEQVVANRRQQFDQFLADPSGGQPLAERDRNQLFEDFLEMERASVGEHNASRLHRRSGNGGAGLGSQ
jgi:hypothetical protein